MIYHNFSHIIQIGIIVQNAEQTAKRLKTILGWEPWGIWETSRVPGRIYHNKEEDFACKMIFYAFPGIEIEVIEPLCGKSCWHDFLNKNGEGIHHLLFDINDSANTEAELEKYEIRSEQRGRALPYGDNVYWAYVTSQEQLGFVMELTNRREYPSKIKKETKMVQGDFSRLMQIGIVVRDAEITTERWKKILGWEPYRFGSVLKVTDKSYLGKPEDFKFKSAFYKFPNIDIEQIQPLHGKSCWQDFLDERGEGIHHILFEVDDSRVLNELENQGITSIQKYAIAYGGKRATITSFDTKDIFGFQMEVAYRCD